MGKYGQHRLMVVDKAGTDMQNVITQSALVRYLSSPSFAPKLAALGDKTLEELGLGNSGKVCVAPHALVVVSSVTCAWTRPDH